MIENTKMGGPTTRTHQFKSRRKPAPSEPVMTQMTERTSATCNPIFDESFVLAVTEAKNSQLEITLWDVETPQPTNGFLGEVILNVGKLESLAGAEITQAFPLKTGKSIATSLEARGTLQMTLKYEKPDTAGSQESASAEPETKAPMSRERFPVGSERWAQATAWAFSMLTQEACAEVAKPEWWSDEGLKALSARVVRAAPDDEVVHQMRGLVLSGQHSAWEAGPRSAAELREAAAHFDRAAALCPAPAGKAEMEECADICRRRAGGV